MAYFVFEKNELANGSEFYICDGKSVANQKKSGTSKYASDPTLGSALPPGYANYISDGGILETLPDVRNMKIGDLQEVCEISAKRNLERAMASVYGGYTPAERSTWSFQLSEAQNYLSGVNSDFIDSVSAAGGENPKDFASKVVAKNNAYSSAVSSALATYRATIATIENAKELKDLPKFTLDDLSFVYPRIQRTPAARDTK